jgi:tetratricopeptide (TPR) repeat protein
VWGGAARRGKHPLSTSNAQHSTSNIQRLMTDNPPIWALEVEGWVLDVQRTTILVAAISLADWDSSMSKKSRARAEARAATSARASAARTISAPLEPNIYSTRSSTLFAGGIIVLAALVAYHNSFSGPFILDDSNAITENPSIKHFGTALSPPPTATTGGRPLLNLTFALNYALSGMDVWGYHAFNLFIHALAGLTLFGIVRRILYKGALNERLGAAALPLALAVAVIWVVHPLQTETVTYISQRAESLMGLFYLLTLYCFIRGVESPSPVKWQILSVVALFLGVMSKEPIVTVPVIVFLFDRTFVTGTFREAWRQRWRYYLGLASAWLLLACLMVDVNQRGVGFSQGVTWWNYALTSCRTVILYLKLAIWPHPLVFDYGTNAIAVRHATEIAPYALVVTVLLTSTAIALWRWPVMGFAGAWFFLILAPTSSVVPVAFQPMAENRMYLPLVAVVGLIVFGLYKWTGRYSLFVLVTIAIGLGWCTIKRNEDYCSALIMWNDTVAKCPSNARAHYDLGVILTSLNRSQEAIAQYEAALWINPNYAEAHNNLGVVLETIPGRLLDAISQYEAALRIEPDDADTHCNLGNALFKIPGHLPDAIAEYRAALRIEPDDADAYLNLGNALLNIPGRVSGAIFEYQMALRIKPDDAETHNDLGKALSQFPGRLLDAIAEFRAALQIKPNYAEAHYNLGRTLAQVPGRSPQAISEYEAALRINPEYAKAHNNLGAALAKIPGRLPEAISHYEAALRVNPDYAMAHYNLGAALAMTPGQLPEAIFQYEAALRINPDLAEAHNSLGSALATIPGRLPEAISHYEAALRINPNLIVTHYNLANALLQQNRYSGACEQYEDALKLKPNFSEGYLNLGVTLAKMGRLRDAIDQFEAALRIKPNDPTAREDLEEVKNLSLKELDNDFHKHSAP